jgi:hypothetical protein
MTATATDTEPAAAEAAAADDVITGLIVAGDAAEEALRVAFLDAVSEAAKTAYEQGRADAETAFAAIRAKGQPQQEILLGGERLGKVSIHDGGRKVTVDEGKLLEFARQNLTGAVEEYIDPNWVSNRAVIEMVRDCFPGSVCERIRPETYRLLLKQMEENDGVVTIKGTGVTARLGTVEKTDPTGAFTLLGTDKEKRRAAIIAAWQAGKLPDSVTRGLTWPSRAITAGGEAR